MNGTAWASPPVWQQQARLRTSHGDGGRNFGLWVAQQGDTAMVGSVGKSDGSRPGSVEFFARTGLSWRHQDTVDVAPGHRVYEVALDGDTALFLKSRPGAPAGEHSGWAVVLVRTGDGWSQQAELTGDEGNEFSLDSSLALSGDTVMGSTRGPDGRRGPVYVFVRSGSAWGLQAKIPYGDAWYGDSSGAVALSGDSALIGWNDEQEGKSVRVFTRAAGQWTQQAILLPSEGSSGLNLNTSLALDGDTALVGIPTSVYGRTGAVHVFTRSGTTWSQQASLHSDGPVQTAGFGDSVALDHERALIGDTSERDGGVQTGAAYVFERTGTTWVQRQKLIPPDSDPPQTFGFSVALSGSTALIGAIHPIESPGAKPTSGVDVFTLAAPVGDPCGPGLPTCAIACVEDTCASDSPSLDLEGGRCSTGTPGSLAPSLLPLLALALAATRRRASRT